jgi:hypothetical protein
MRGINSNFEIISEVIRLFYLKEIKVDGNCLSAQSYMNRKWTWWGQVRMNLFPINLLNTYMRTWKNNQRTTKRARIIGTLLPVVPVWFVITIISFMAIVCVTESDINQIIADTTTPTKNQIMPYLVQVLGLNQPIHIHYLRWMGLMKQEDGQYKGVLQGNLGESLWYYPKPSVQ